MSHKLADFVLTNQFSYSKWKSIEIQKTVDCFADCIAETFPSGYG